MLVLLNRKEKCNYQCTGQSPTTICSSRWSLQRCVTSRFSISFCISTKADSRCMVHLHPALGPSPSPALLPNGDHCVLPFQDVYKTMLRLFLLSSPRETSFPCKKSVLSLAFLPECNPVNLAPKFKTDLKALEPIPEEGTKAGEGAGRHVL